MDLEQTFNELKNKPKTLDNIPQLKELLNAAKAADNSSLYLEILLKMSETYKYCREHQNAIDLLEQVINEDFLQVKDERIKAIDELVNILLRTEDFVKLKTLLFNREKYLTSSQEKTMQNFYESVCFEGLVDYQKAIDSLVKIPDNVASNILVNKYLKLAMLYLKVDDFATSQKMYDLAVKFDTKKKNPIFDLVMSDISFYQSDYQTALDHYQAYFIKTRNRHRYLDRFILINIALNQYDEAWQFYQKYLPKMNQVISQNSRIIFYEAAMKLCEKLNDDVEMHKLQKLVDDLKAAARPLYNSFDNIYQILNLSFANKVYYKEREFIHDVFKALSDFTDFEKLVYAKIVDENIHILHYSKGLLLERTLTSDDYHDSEFAALLQQDKPSFVSDKTDFNKYSQRIFWTEKTEYIFINQIMRKSKDREFFLAYTSDLKRYDDLAKMVLLAKEILAKQLNDFSFQINRENLIKNYRLLIDKENYGILKIKNSFIQLLNQNAKQILGEEIEYLDYDKFQERVVDQDLYIDDLLNMEKSILRYKFGNQTKTLEIAVVKDEFEIYILVKDITNSLENPLVTKNNLIFSDYKDISQIRRDINDTEPRTILAFRISSAYDFFKDYSIERYREFVGKLIGFLKAKSRSHFHDIYLESIDNLYLLLDTTDKRVISRIINSFENDFYQTLDADADIRMSGIQINGSVDNEAILKLKYLLALTDKANRYLFDNKNFKYNQELAKTIQLNIEKLIEAKTIALSYQVIGEWETMKERFLDVKPADKLMLGDDLSRERVIRAHELENEWDLLLVKNLLAQIKKAQQRHSFAVKLFAKTFANDTGLKKLLALISNSGAAFNSFIFVFDINELINTDLTKALNLLKAKNCLIGYENALEHISIENMEVLGLADYLFINMEALEKVHFQKFTALLGNVEIVLRHRQGTLKKSILKENRIKFVEGAMFPKYDNL